MTRRTKKDVFALIDGHHTNTDKEPGDEVYIRRDEKEKYGEQYREKPFPKSAKPYNYRGNRIESHGWVENATPSDVAPTTRAVGELTETGAAIINATQDNLEEKWRNETITTREFIEQALETYTP